MKKIKYIFFVVFVLFMVSLTVNASAKGDFITSFTDIKAFVNGKEIESLNINGDTYIFVENLSKCGFDVKWNGDERILYADYIYDEYGENNLPDLLNLPNEERNKNHEVFYSDIKVFINQTEIPCFITDDGRAVVKFDYLSVAGEVRWNELERKIRLVTGVYKNYVSFPDESLSYYEEFPDVPSFESVKAPKYTEKFGDSNLSSVTYVYIRQSLTQDLLESYIKVLTDNGFTYLGNIKWDSNIWLKKGETELVMGVDSTYFYVKIYF